MISRMSRKTNIRDLMNYYFRIIWMTPFCCYLIAMLHLRTTTYTFILMNITMLVNECRRQFILFPVLYIWYLLFRFHFKFFFVAKTFSLISFTSLFYFYCIFFSFASIVCDNRLSTIYMEPDYIIIIILNRL